MSRLRPRRLALRWAGLGRVVLASIAAGVWSGGAAADTVVARIELSTQTMFVSVSDGQSYVWPVSTARRGYVTPTGSYRPTRVHRRWYSRKYDNAPMPYAIFFRGGYAIHGTTAIRSLGRPASHGCVRLLPANAATLFGLVNANGLSNTRIVITR